jgi:hypothetical protein
MKLKSETERDDNGDIVGTMTSWVVALRIPSHKVDANEIERMTGEVITIELSPLQTKMKLEGEEE